MHLNADHGTFYLIRLPMPKTGAPCFWSEAQQAWVSGIVPATCFLSLHDARVVAEKQGAQCALALVVLFHNDEDH
jgi:hypothetical protein